MKKSERVPASRCLLAGLLAMMLWVLVPAAPSQGFGTVGLLGQHREHEMITRAALACPPGKKSPAGDCFQPKSLDVIAGKKGTFGAVGDPDDPTAGETSLPAAHCDDADFLNVSWYPRTRLQANVALRSCVNHLRKRFDEGAVSAAPLLTGTKRVDAKQAATEKCPAKIAKCDALMGLGRALHGVQDFYSHSNWVDESRPGLVSEVNPPGLKMATLAPFFDLRRTDFVSDTEFPYDLATGCFVLPDMNPGVLGCKGRVTHEALNKDKGLIDPATGATSGPATERGKVKANFAAAVQAAVADTRRQWDIMREELITRYGRLPGQIMACVLTSDDPNKDCQGRLIGIVIDGSYSHRKTDPDGDRLGAARAFNESLISEAEASPKQWADRVAVVVFGEDEDDFRILSPLGDPSRAEFGTPANDGITLFLWGFGAIVGEMFIPEDENEPWRGKNRAAVVFFSDGLICDTKVQEETTKLWQPLIGLAFTFQSVPPVPTAVTPTPPIDPVSNQVLAAPMNLERPSPFRPSAASPLLPAAGNWAVMRTAPKQYDIPPKCDHPPLR